MSPYDLHLLTLALALAAGAIGWQIIFGLAGALSLAAGTAMGLGAYAVVLLALKLDLPYAVAVPTAALIASLIIAAMGVAAARLETHYFALATLAMAEGVVLVAINWESLTGGANGLLGPTPPDWLLDDQGKLFLSASVTLIAVFIYSSFKRYAGQEKLALLRSHPLAAKAFGINGPQTRLIAMLAGGLCGGLGGAIHALAVGVVSPDILSFKTMAAILAVVLIGGRYSPLAAVITSIAVTFGPEYLRFLEDSYLIFYGLLLLLAILFLPTGIAGLFPKFSLIRSSNKKAEKFPIKDEIPLRSQGLHRSFGGLTAVNNVSLNLKKGEIVGLIGPNGAGKSTLLNLLSGIDRPDSGQIELAFGVRIGRTFQTPALIEDETVDGNYAVVGYKNNDRRLVKSLSQSERRFVEITRAREYANGVVLLDEPAAGLSSDERSKLTEEIRKLAKTAAVVIVEHNVPFVAKLADRLVCLSEGRIIADGKPKDLVRNPIVVSAYLGAAMDLGHEQ